MAGHTVTTLMEGELDWPDQLAIYDDYLYWVDGGDSIQRSKLDGTGVVETLVEGLQSIRAFIVHNDQLYCSNYGGGPTIRRVNLDDTSVVEILVEDGLGYVHALAVHNDQLYFSNSSNRNGTIRRSNLDGTDVVTLVEGLSYGYK